MSNLPKRTPSAQICALPSDATLERSYREQRNWLVAFLKRRFGSEDAEDLAQETYARALASAGEIRNPKAFLARIAVNAAHDRARRRKARPKLVAAELAPERAAPASQTEAVQLKQVILALPPKLQEVFLLSRFGGLTYEEIAQRCGVSVKTVEARMTKALAMCSALLD